MLGKCPKCEIKLIKKELDNLKKGESARCFKCGGLFSIQPFWIYIKLSLLFLPFIIPLIGSNFLTLISCFITFLTVVFYHEVQAYMPLVEDKDL